MKDLPSEPTLADLAAYIERLEARKGWSSATVERKCFLLGEEVGELFKAVRVHQKHPSDAAVEAVSYEIVDVLNYLLAIANRLDMDLEAAFRGKNSQNETRTWS